jgi:hypothetical protein
MSWTQLYKDERIWGCERYILTSNPRELMDIPPEVLKSVVFVGYQDIAKKKYFSGTAVLVSRARIGDVYFSYFVTAKHVIDGIKELGIKTVLLRMNMKSGNAEWVPTDLKDWVFPPDKSVDVAVLPYAMKSDVDHEAFPIYFTLDDQFKEQFKVGVGNDVFVTGLFHPHKGQKNNIPIVRVGNIAAMPAERIATKKFGLIEAYLIEARSISGLSGSPVFLSLGISRSSGGFHVGEFNKVFLLGIVHGHFDAPKGGTPDAVSVEDAADEKLNVGIAIVVPFEKVLETISQPQITEQEDALIKKEAEQNLPTMDSGSHPAGEPMQTTKDGKKIPIPTRERFLGDLGKASRKKP